MKNFTILLALALLWLVPGDSFPRGPGGGGGGARPAGGGGHPTPSFSGARPQQASPQHAAQPGGHPGFVPGNQPHPTPNRPDNNRPNGGGQRPNEPNRPNTNGNNPANPNRNVNNNYGNQANVNRPNNNNTVNRTNNFNNQSGIGNRTNNYSNQGNIGNRSYGYSAYQGHWAGWHSGSWSNWNSRPAAWVGAGTAAGVAGGWMLGAGENYAYSNPFYSTAPTDPGPDYSQPIAVPAPQPPPVSTPDADPPPQQQPPAVPDEVTREVNEARTAFKQLRYATAQDLVQQAIAGLPGDTTLHEFRSLTLFAQGKYKDAASSIYAVLSAGPGWNWETMKSFYPNVDTYTRQLRALESFVKANPKSSDGHFLLAYHYLVLNQTPAAVKELQQVVQLVPNDKLCPQLIRAFAPPDADRPTPQVP